MKAIFEFELPEDQHDYDVMNQASKVQRFLWEFSQQLRNWEKNNHEFTSADSAVYGIREEFYKLLNSYEINIDL